MNNLIALKRQLVNDNNDTLWSEIISIESCLLALNDSAMEGVKTRSRAQWLEEGEKPLRYFFITEKERTEKNYGKSIYYSDETFSLW